MSKRIDTLLSEFEKLNYRWFFFSFKVGRPKKDSPKLALENYKKKYTYRPTVLCLDVGDTTGFVVLDVDGLIVGYIPKNQISPPENLVSLINLLGSYASRRSLVVLIEGGYCPAYKPIFYSGVSYGVALLQPSLACVELIPPHLKPAVRKEKSERLRIKELVKTLREHFSVPDDIKLEPNFAHSASAYGLLEFWLRKEGLYASDRISDE